EVPGTGPEYPPRHTGRISDETRARNAAAVEEALAQALNRLRQPAEGAARAHFEYRGVDHAVPLENRKIGGRRYGDRPNQYRVDVWIGDDRGRLPRRGLMHYLQRMRYRVDLHFVTTPMDMREPWQAYEVPGRASDFQVRIPPEFHEMDPELRVQKLADELAT